MNVCRHQKQIRCRLRCAKDPDPLRTLSKMLWTHRKFDYDDPHAYKKMNLCLPSNLMVVIFESVEDIYVISISLVIN